MKNPGPGLVILLAIRSAACGAPNGVPRLLSLSKVSRTTTFALDGTAETGPFAKRTVSPTPKTDESSEKTSVAMLKLMNSSPATTCRPGAVKTEVPANGSVLNMKVDAGAVEQSAKSPATMQETFQWRISIFLLLICSENSAFSRSKFVSDATTRPAMSHPRSRYRQAQ